MPKFQTKFRRIPQCQKDCLSQEEAQTIYDCLEADQVVSPLHFNKDIIKTSSHRRLAYQKLEEILEQEGSVNPYQVMLLGPDQEETTPDHLFNIDMYDSNKNNPGRVNTQNMED